MVRAKSMLLTILVVLSMVLSSLIIFGQPVPVGGEEAPGPWFGPKPGLHEISLPTRIYTLAPEGEILLLKTLSPMYSELILTLGQMNYGDETGSDWVSGEYDSESICCGVLFRYDYQISRGLLASWLTRFYETDFPFAFIDSIFVPLDGGPVKFINTAIEYQWQLQVDLPLSVFQQATEELHDSSAGPFTVMNSNEAYSVACDIYDLANEQRLAVPVCKTEEIKGEIIQSFFLNPSIIQEADGTKTYTDGLGALRLFPSGALEYTAGVKGQGDPYMDQLLLAQKSLDFIHVHGGWPGGLLPVSFSSRPGELTRLELSGLAAGLPLLGDNVGITIDFQQGLISTFNRYLVSATGEIATHVSIKPLAWHLATDSQIGQLFEKEAQTISDLSLAYYWHQNRLSPVWQVEVTNHVIIASATDGRIFRIRARLEEQ